jgi:hypothetical protein
LEQNNSRSGVLGEAAINLVDCINFVQKEKSLVLLKGAVTSGTVLHVSRLFLSKSREHERSEECTLSQIFSVKKQRA